MLVASACVVRANLTCMPASKRERENENGDENHT